MTNYTNSKIQTVVVRRVRTIYFMQSPYTTVAIAGIIFTLAMWGIGREVWVAHVLHNMPSLSNLDAVIRFYLAAFMNTRFIVQALSVIAVGAFVWLVMNSFRLVRETARFA